LAKEGGKGETRAKERGFRVCEGEEGGKATEGKERGSRT
jgi:hypothetical protein